MRPSLLAYLIIGASLMMGCSEARNGTGMISQRIGEIVHTPGANEVDIGKLTTFGWEYFYAFKLGTSREEVCKFIGANRNVCGRLVRIEKAPEDHMFLIFGLNGQLTHIELHAVENGKFDMQFTEQGHPRSKSVFKIRRSASSSDKDTILLEPK